MKYMAVEPIQFRNKKVEAGDTFKPKNPETIKKLLEEGKARPVRDILTEKYNQLVEWLHSHDLTGDVIKEALPELYDAIQKAIDDLDNAFIIEDLQGFLAASEKVKRLYLAAITELKRERQEL